MEQKEICHKSTELVVEYEFTKGEERNWNSPGMPDRYTLFNVWVFDGDLNIIDVITDEDQREIIELLKD
jgi:hypothetical protein